MAASIDQACVYCEEVINGVRVQCCECSDFDLCVECFCGGAEIGAHKKNHSYRLIEPVILGGHDGWTAMEELKLLETMDLCGFGSWQYVSEKIKTRTAEEVKEKYMTRYFGKVGWNEMGESRPTLMDHTAPERADAPRLPPLNTTPEQAEELGYMALREDFHDEYDYGAESLVCTLQINEDDSELEKALKLACVAMYRRRLRERDRRKRLACNYQLSTQFFEEEEAAAKGRKKEGPLDAREEFRMKMRTYSQFLSANEHQRLIESIERERELRQRLGDLLRYRGLGLTTRDEIAHYEQPAIFQQQQHARQKRIGSSVFKTADNHHSENGITEGSVNDRHTHRNEHEHCSANKCIRAQSDNGKLVPITKLPQAYLLSLSELQFCAILNLLPVHYRTLKRIILQDYLNSNGQRKKSDAVCNGNAESPTIKDVITEYMNESGWLPGYHIN